MIIPIEVRGREREGVVIVTQNNLINVDDFSDHAGRDYSLKPGVAAIDAGTHVEGITTDVVGTPDLGTYEFGKPKWTADSNIQVPNFPDEEKGWEPTSIGVKKYQMK